MDLDEMRDRLTRIRELELAERVEIMRADRLLEERFKAFQRIFQGSTPPDFVEWEVRQFGTSITRTRSLLYPNEAKLSDKAP